MLCCKVSHGIVWQFLVLCGIVYGTAWTGSAVQDLAATTNIADIVCYCFLLCGIAWYCVVLHARYGMWYTVQFGQHRQCRLFQQLILLILFVIASCAVYSTWYTVYVIV